MCSQNVAVGKERFELTAVVEHVSGSTDSRSGHYVTWVKEPATWKKCDDISVTRTGELPETVNAGVVVAFYNKASDRRQPACW